MARIGLSKTSLGLIRAGDGVWLCLFDEGLPAAFIVISLGFAPLQISQPNHPLRFDVPNLQSQTANDIVGMERSCLGGTQLGNFRKDLGQAIKRDVIVQMMDVVISDITSKPRPKRTGLEVAGRIQSRFLVCPPRLVAERNTREIMLCVKQICPDGTGDKMRNDLRQYQSRPTEEPHERYRDRDMHNKSDAAIVMFPGTRDEWDDAHPV